MLFRSCASLAIWLLCCAGTMLLFSLKGNFTGPISALWILNVLLLDLAIRSPIMAARSRFYCGTEKQNVFRNAFKKSEYKKAVILRFFLWKERLLWSVAALFPAMFIAGCVDLVSKTQYASASSIVPFLLQLVFAAFMAVGFLFVEWRMLRYWAAWAYLSRCHTAREAIEYSKQFMRQNAGECAKQKVYAAFQRLFCLLIIPYFTLFPQWETQRMQWFSKGANSKRVT